MKHRQAISILALKLNFFNKNYDAVKTPGVHVLETLKN